MRVRDVMTKSLVTIGPEETLADLESLLLAKRIGGVPVVERGRLVGIVSRSDLVRLLGTEQSIADVQIDSDREYREDAFASDEVAERTAAAAQVAERLARFRVRDAMVSEVASVDAEAPLREVARQLAERRIHRLVVTEGGRLAGIVSTLDLVRAIAEGRIG
jgi:CBS domain-containing protein